MTLYIVVDQIVDPIVGRFLGRARPLNAGVETAVAAHTERKRDVLI